jgi:hypothetical protein
MGRDHFFPHALITHVMNDLRQETEEMRTRGLLTLYRILDRLENDPRMGEAEAKVRAFNLFIPLVLAITDYKDRLCQAESNNTSENLFTLNERKIMLGTFMLICRYVDKKLLFYWLEKVENRYVVWNRSSD